MSRGLASVLASCGTCGGLGGALTTGPLTSTFTANAVGPQTYSATATDLAGNTATGSANYSVDYGFHGFFAPVANAPAINKIDEKSIVPLLWQVTNASNAGVNGLRLGPSNGGTGTVSITGSNSMACPKHVAVSSITIKSVLNTGLIGLGKGFYLFAWQAKLPENACIDIALNLGDGLLHHAIFQVK